jgi:hypothetical protein
LVVVVGQGGQFLAFFDFVQGMQFQQHRVGLVVGLHRSRRQHLGEQTIRRVTDQRQRDKETKRQRDKKRETRHRKKKQERITEIRKQNTSVPPPPPPPTTTTTTVDCRLTSMTSVLALASASCKITGVPLCNANSAREVCTMYERCMFDSRSTSSSVEPERRTNQQPEENHEESNHEESIKTIISKQGSVLNDFAIVQQ